jgi:hypothetical protein
MSIAALKVLVRSMFKYTAFDATPAQAISSNACTNHFMIATPAQCTSHFIQRLHTPFHTTPAQAIS